MSRELQKLVRAVGQKAQKANFKIATAESCTGGGLSYWLTSISGSSAWFECGFVTYSDVAKAKILGVSPQTIEKFGAVSEQTVREMAEGTLNQTRADISIAITGIAGPKGALPQKPVGTVWIAWAKRNRPTEVEMNLFPGTRAAVRIKSIERALEKLLDMMDEPLNNTR